jgi:hypothetical protein
MERSERQVDRQRYRAGLRVWLVWAWGLSACRIGGASPDDAASFVDEQPVATPTVGDAGQQSEDAPVPAGGTPNSSSGSPPAANTGNAAGNGVSPTSPAGSTSPPTGSTNPPKAGSSAPSTPSADGCGQPNGIEVCDPIRNEGCSRELGMQCDVDLFASSLSGQCVFKAEPMDPAHCLNIPPTETCPPGQTCVDGDQCHKVCLCDSDCDAGDCCSILLGNKGFKTCSKC